jgi:hypothetical protein
MAEKKYETESTRKSTSMNLLKNSLPVLLATAFGLPMSSASAWAQQWIAPTPEELSMTSIKEVPGAAAVYLNKDETTDDSLHMHSFYFRVKVLTEKGKDYANVELPFYVGDGGTSVTDIGGRTIHPDGTIVEFNGKPYEKLIAKTGDVKMKAKVFTLPSVDVGSIIEYRYKQRLDDNYYQAPQWYIQTGLYTRKAHYLWRPTEQDLTNDKGEIVSGAIAWSPILPPGAAIEQSTVMTGGHQMELSVHDIPPLATEDYMPPVYSVSYRVLFYYTPYHSVDEFWTSMGKKWSRETDKFVGPSKKVAEYANSLVLPGDTDDQKARKLYAAVMSMENTDLTREHTKREEKAEGFRELKSSEDIMTRKRGSSDQLTELFVGMSRAAGLKAYVMGLSDRNERLFLKSYLSLRQLDAEIAIVSIGGKDVFFDPGERYCEAEHLSWRHAGVGGLRQVDSGTALSVTPGESYKAEHTTRVADLKLDEHGVADGTVTTTYQGDSALHWRQVALTGDETSLQNDLKTAMEGMLPGGMDVKVAGVENLTDPDKPLKVKYDVKGAVGSSTGKRLLVPADIFMVNEKPRFSSPKREIAVDMHYASFDQDAVRFKLPQGMAVESAPDPEREKLLEVAVFDIKSAKGPDSITSFRNVTIGIPLFFPADYGALKTFYGKLEAKDQETLVLTRVPATATAPAAAAKTGS